MGASIRSLGIDKLNIEEKLTLVEDIWDSIATENEDNLLLTEDERNELDRRIADEKDHPEDVISWDEVKADFSKRLRK